MRRRNCPGFVHIEAPNHCNVKLCAAEVRNVSGIAKFESLNHCKVRLFSAGSGRGRARTDSGGEWWGGITILKVQVSNPQRELRGKYAHFEGHNYWKVKVFTPETGGRGGRMGGGWGRGRSGGKGGKGKADGRQMAGRKGEGKGCVQT